MKSTHGLIFNAVDYSVFHKGTSEPERTVLIFCVMN